MIPHVLSPVVRIVLPFALIVAGLFVASMVTREAGDDPSGGARTAVIVDQLSLTYPNEAFVEAASGILDQAGYGVDYVSGEDVTVGFYRELPVRNYDLVVLRVHLGLTRSQTVGLFTSEAYSEGKYDEPGLARTYYGPEEPRYFGVAPEFVKSAMNGSFGGALVIMMGCNGLRTRAAADAFVERGAGAVVGWDGDVSADHTDAATERLLQKLLTQGELLQRAVAETRAEIGPDPVFGAELRVLASGQ